MKRDIKYIGVIALFSASLCWGAPNSVDVQRMDIAGIQLGMTPIEAAAAITKKLGLSKRSVEFDKFPQLNVVTKTKEPLYFIVKTPGAIVRVHFEANVPYDPKRKLAVSMVTYEQPWTPDNAVAMKQMATEKYGEPSNGTIPAQSQWCLHPHENPGFGCFEFVGPKLSLASTTLQMEDPSYRRAVIEFMNKKATSKPTF